MDANVSYMDVLARPPESSWRRPSVTAIPAYVNKTIQGPGLNASSILPGTPINP